MSVRQSALVFAAFASVAAAATAASAGSVLTAQYFEVPDVGQAGDFGICCSSGPATLPVITLGSSLSGGLPVTTLLASSGGVVDQSATGQILWWTPSQATGVAYTGTVLTSLPFSSTNMYAPNNTGPNDAGFFETAILSGNFAATGADVQVSVTSDDVAFIYVDGKYVGGNPGVHGDETSNIDLGDLNGSHSLEIFYADRAQTGADLSVDVTGAITSGVPEPTSWAMMLVGFGGLGAAMRSRRKQAVATA